MLRALEKWVVQGEGVQCMCLCNQAYEDGLKVEGTREEEVLIFVTEKDESESCFNV